MKTEDVLSALFFEVFNNKKSIRFILNGSSMYPALKDGDILTVKSISFHEAEAGDILAYQHIATKRIIIHRMVKRNHEDNSIATAAEAGRYFKYDPPLTQDKYLVSKVIAIERGARRVDLTTPVNVLKARIRTYIFIHCHILIRIQQKIYRLFGRLY
ncbi:MAG: S26 family signal peptidase [Candidatus Omnitrophota bacterium]|nr:S26 family signal peptidase [Candidatus Omnitrophota bacterium]